MSAYVVGVSRDGLYPHFEVHIRKRFDTPAAAQRVVAQIDGIHDLVHELKRLRDLVTSAEDVESIDRVLEPYLEEK